jgi:hypothetical protein
MYTTNISQMSDSVCSKPECRKQIKDYRDQLKCEEDKNASASLLRKTLESDNDDRSKLNKIFEDEIRNLKEQIRKLDSNVEKFKNAYNRNIELIEQNTQLKKDNETLVTDNDKYKTILDEIYGSVKKFKSENKRPRTDNDRSESAPPNPPNPPKTPKTYIMNTPDELTGKKVFDRN